MFVVIPSLVTTLLMNLVGGVEPPYPYLALGQEPSFAIVGPLLMAGVLFGAVLAAGLVSGSVAAVVAAGCVLARGRFDLWQLLLLQVVLSCAALVVSPALAVLPAVFTPPLLVAYYASRRLGWTA